MHSLPGQASVYCRCRRRHEQLCHQRGRPAADAAARLPAEPAHLAPGSPPWPRTIRSCRPTCPATPTPA